MGAFPSISSLARELHVQSGEGLLIDLFLLMMSSIMFPGLLNLTADEGFAFCYVASVSLLIKSSSSGGLWYLHPRSVEVIADNVVVLGFSWQLSLCFCYQLFCVCCSLNQWFQSSSRHTKSYWLCPVYNAFDGLKKTCFSPIQLSKGASSHQLQTMSGEWGLDIVTHKQKTVCVRHIVTYWKYSFWIRLLYQ